MSTLQQPMQLKALALDLGNVLVRVDHLEFCRRLAPYTNSTPEEIFDQVFGSSLEPSYDTGQLSTEEFFQQTLQHFQTSLPFALFADFWNSIFSPLEGMEEVVARLARRYPLFLISNTNALHFDFIRQQYPLLNVFRKFILSYEVGSRKPEPGIYQFLIGATGLPPQHCLFIDDKLPFITAAHQHGLHAWQFLSCEDFQEKLTQQNLW